MNKIYSRYIVYSIDAPSIEVVLYKMKIMATLDKIQCKTLDDIDEGKSYQEWIDAMRSCPGFIEFIIEDLGPLDDIRKYILTAVFDNEDNALIAKLSICP